MEIVTSYALECKNKRMPRYLYAILPGLYHLYRTDPVHLL